MWKEFFLMPVVVTLKDALTTGFTSLSGSILGIAVIVVPVAMGIWAAILGVKYAKKFFSAISK